VTHYAYTPEGSWVDLKKHCLQYSTLQMVYIQTNTHNYLKDKCKRTQPDGSISTKVTLFFHNWSVTQFRLNNGRLVDALEPNKAAFFCFVKEAHIRTALIPTEKQHFYRTFVGEVTLCE